MKRGKIHGFIDFQVNQVASLVWMKSLMTISSRTMKQHHFPQKPICRKEDWKKWKVQ